MDKHTVLRQYFGYDQFRPGQETLIDAILAGRDALGIMPTGAGKSLCFQVPALLLPGITLVISPLISLMRDQVLSLVAAGAPAAFFNSSLTETQYTKALALAARGKYKIIYVAPERLLTDRFQAFLRQVEISLVAVDEAHCVSQWGQDFRPSYLQIPEFLRTLPYRPVTAAFTATATGKVHRDIVQLLELEDPKELVTGFDRPNLYFSVQTPLDKDAALLRILRAHAGDSGIVYCSTRKNVEEVCAALQREGIPATRYHAGLSPEERRANQQSFTMETMVMVATNAFGMGIDKSDVRFVVHYNMPKDLESYYQEAGRAGRDGEAADCTLLYSGRYVAINRFLISKDRENERLTPEQQKQVAAAQEERLRQMVSYCYTDQCLRRRILAYFGEDAPLRCHSCSNCRAVQAPKTLPPEPLEAQAEAALFQQLKNLRTTLARRRGVPAFVIFSDATLRDMVRRHPTTPAEFLQVSGVGKQKAAQYGDDFLKLLREAQEK